MSCIIYIAELKKRWKKRVKEGDIRKPVSVYGSMPTNSEYLKYFNCVPIFHFKLK